MGLYVYVLLLFSIFAHKSGNKNWKNAKNCQSRYGKSECDIKTLKNIPQLVLFTRFFMIK